MTPPSNVPSVGALHARIDLLERRLRRERRFMLSLALLTMCGLLVAAKPSPGPVVASAFVLVDDRGRTQGQLAVSSEGEATFLLRNPTGTGDAGLIVKPSGASALRLRGPKRSVTLEVAEDGRGELRIQQAHAKTVVAAGIDPAGQPSIVLNDKHGKVAFDSRRLRPER